MKRKWNDPLFFREMRNRLVDIIQRGKEIVWICIGTDRSTGDAFGPLVGSRLHEYKIPNVYGTLHDPVHALNLKQTLCDIRTQHPGAIVIAVDSCLGLFSCVESIEFAEGPLKPGSGVQKVLPDVGDYKILGYVNVSGFMEVLVVNSTRLSVVMDMANVTALSIYSACSVTERNLEVV